MRCNNARRIHQRCTRLQFKIEETHYAYTEHNIEEYNYKTHDYSGRLNYSLNYYSVY